MIVVMWKPNQSSIFNMEDEVKNSIFANNHNPDFGKNLHFASSVSLFHHNVACDIVYRGFGSTVSDTLVLILTWDASMGILQLVIPPVNLADDGS